MQYALWYFGTISLMPMLGWKTPSQNSVRTDFGVKQISSYCILALKPYRVAFLPEAIDIETIHSSACACPQTERRSTPPRMWRHWRSTRSHGTELPLLSLSVTLLCSFWLLVIASITTWFMCWRDSCSCRPGNELLSGRHNIWILSFCPWSDPCNTANQQTILCVKSWHSFPLQCFGQDIDVEHMV